MSLGKYGERSATITRQPSFKEPLSKVTPPQITDSSNQQTRMYHSKTQITILHSAAEYGIHYEIWKHEIEKKLSRDVNGNGGKETEISKS